LVEDGIDGDGGFTSLSITNDELSLSSTDLKVSAVTKQDTWETHRDQGVDRLETGLHGLVDGSSGQNTGSLQLSLRSTDRVNLSLSVNGVSESVNDSAQKSRSDGNIHNLTSSLDSVSFLDQSIVTENGDTDIVGFQVKTHAS
jgi:hypothetical protein